jgi:hypothetical protein
MDRGRFAQHLLGMRTSQTTAELAGVSRSGAGGRRRASSDAVVRRGGIGGRGSRWPLMRMGRQGAVPPSSARMICRAGQAPDYRPRMSRAKRAAGGRGDGFGPKTSRGRCAATRPRPQLADDGFDFGELGRRGTEVRGQSSGGRFRNGAGLWRRGGDGRGAADAEGAVGGARRCRACG